MKTVFLSLLLLSSFAAAAFAQPQNITISETTLFDGEPFLAVNPTNPDNMIIAWMSYVPNPGIPILDQIGIRTKASFDGGRTWGNEIMMPHYSKTFTRQMFLWLSIKTERSI